MKRERLWVSFSGGRTSAYMAKRLKDEYSDRFEMIFVFANTGEEWEQTLQFVHRCDQEWGLNLVYLEAVTHPGDRQGCTHQIVDFTTAARNGEPFEAMIQKYGIPNKAYPHCTRELKLNAMLSYVNSIGWGDAKRAVGIRIDEPKRLRRDAIDVGIVYPLANLFSTSKPEINEWWQDQPFNLELMEHQGNCKCCWKKSEKKLVRIAIETPEAYGFSLRMEANYGLAGYNLDGTPRVFFREHRSAKDLLAIAEICKPTLFSPEYLDEDSGCSESCEPF